MNPSARRLTRPYRREAHNPVCVPRGSNKKRKPVTTEWDHQLPHSGRQQTLLEGPGIEKAEDVVVGGGARIWPSPWRSRQYNWLNAHVVFLGEGHRRVCGSAGLFRGMSKGCGSRLANREGLQIRSPSADRWQGCVREILLGMSNGAWRRPRLDEGSSL